MLEFIQSQILFYFSIILVLFAPGYFLMLAIFGGNNNYQTTNNRQKATFLFFSPIEKLVISFGLSIATVNFLIILIGWLRIPITKWSIILAIALFSVLCYGIFKITQYHFGRTSGEAEKSIKNKKWFANLADPPTAKIFFKKIFYSFRMTTLKNGAEKETAAAFSFSKNQTILIILILFLTIFIKSVYLKDTVFPTSTDLGHHMYWSKLISQTGELPNYQESDVIEVNENYAISEPKQIADFIIGEHLIFSATNLISGIDFISYFPTLILFLIHLMGILAVFILTLKMFNKKNIAIIALFLLGALYAIASPGVKFVSGGVIGNTLGNLFIPLSLYFYYRALKEKNSWFLTIGLFLTAGMFYAHHLSSFIFIFITGFIVIMFLLFYFTKLLPIQKSKVETKNLKLKMKEIEYEIQNYLKLFFSPQVTIFLFFTFLFLIFVYTPSYIETSAVETAIGGPSKSTRAGLTLTQLKHTAGEPRMALGLIGLMLLLLNVFRNDFKFKILNSDKKILKNDIKNFLLPATFLIGWTAALFAMTLKPQWLNLDIPSGRIANYISFPLTIIAAYGLYYIFNTKNYLSKKLLFIAYCLLLAALFTDGFYNNSQSLSTGSNPKEANQIFHASAYLASSLKNGEIILKDHNYLTADTWMKLFFMQDYNFPLSRSYFKRYEDQTKPREMCTLWMISDPNSEQGKKCYNDLGVKYITVNQNFDEIQFKKSAEFWKVYGGKDINVYYKK